MKKRILRIIAFVFGGIIIALILLPFIFEDDIKQGVKDALNDSLYASVDFEDISLSFIRSFPKARLSIDKLEVAGIDTFKGIPLFSADKTVVEVGLISLFKKSTPYDIKSVTIDKPLLNLVILSDGVTANYLIARESEEQAEYTIDLKGYTARDGTIHFKNYANGLYVEAHQVYHEGKGALTQDIFDLTTKTRSDDFTITYGGMPVLHKVNANLDAVLHVDLPNETYTFKENIMYINELQVKMDGFVRYLEDDMDIDLTFASLETNFSHLYSIVPFVYTEDLKGATIQGDGNITAFIKGIYNSDTGKFPHYQMKVNINNGVVQYQQLPKSIKDIFLNAEIGNNLSQPDHIKADIPFFRFRMDEDFFDGRLLYTGNPQSGYVDMGLKSNINLSNWLDVIPLESGTELRGKIVSDILLKSSIADIENQNYQNIVFSGTASASDIRIKKRDTPEIKLKSLNLTASPALMALIIDGLEHPVGDLKGSLDMKNPLALLTGKGGIVASVRMESQKLNLNNLYAGNSNQNTDSRPGFQERTKLPSMEIEFDGKINELNSDEYTFNYVTLSGNLNDNTITLRNTGLTHIESDVKINGELDGWNGYLNGSQPLTGRLDIASNKLDLNPFMVENTGGNEQDAHLVIPKDLNIAITANIKDLKYTNFNISNLKGQLDIADEEADLNQLTGDILGGKFIFQGLYSTKNVENPSFNIKLELATIGFKESFNTFNTFQSLAPVAQFIDGIFNTTLVMEGQLNEKMVPVLNSLNASGYMETLNGQIKGLPPLEKLGNTLGVDVVKNWTIQNSRNWFEVINGMVELKEKTFDLGNNITMGIWGKHGLGRELDYNFQLALPREYLRKNPITGALDAGLSQLEIEAAKFGINIDQGEFLIVDIKMTGSFNNPTFKIAPSGKSKIKLDDVVKQEMAKREEELKDMVSETQKKVIDTLEKTRDKMIDSLQNLGDQKVQEVRDSLQKIIDKEKQSILDSIKKKTGLDDVILPKFDSIQINSPKDVDQIKDKIKEWNPLKKKTGGG